MESEHKEFRLFRQKSLEAIESPEELNDYLKVTSPGLWLVLAAIIALLTGILIWSVFGRIETTCKVAVISENGTCICLVPYEELENATSCGQVTIEDKTYTLQTDSNSQLETISENTNPYICLAGDLSSGELVVRIPVDADLSENIYSGTIITESLQPISLLLN